MSHIVIEGEFVFVKPGFAFNDLVKNNRALFSTDPRIQEYIDKIDVDALKHKQEVRNLDVFLNKLKDIRIYFDREPSNLNKNVAKEPIIAEEVLEAINKRYNLGIKEEDFKMETSIDMIGEHFV